MAYDVAVRHVDGSFCTLILLMKMMVLTIDQGRGRRTKSKVPGGFMDLGSSLAKHLTPRSPTPP